MSMTVTWTLGELLAKARKDAGFDQTQLANAVGIARNSLSNYETGRSMPQFDVTARIAAACGVSLEWLATGVNAETPPTEVEGVSSLSQHSVRPKGLEPLTFCFGGTPRNDAGFWTAERSLELASIWCQLELDAEIPNGIGVAP